ncbi:thiol-disulfide oxidoreductase DCC family protein [Aliikangiella sp. IMCC44632]
MQTKLLPPHIGATDKVVLFDGVCKVCTAWSKFLIKYDKQQLFKFCSVQSTEGKAVLTHFGLSPRAYETMLYVEGALCLQKSNAFLAVMMKLGYPWKFAGVFYLIPKRLRDWCYDRIALNRYKIFGQHDECLLPTPEHKARFINAKH